MLPPPCEIVQVMHTNDPRHHDSMAALCADLDALPPLIGVAELSALSGLAPGTLRNRACAGLRPQPIRVSRRLRYPRAEVIAWLLGGDA